MPYQFPYNKNGPYGENSDLTLKVSKVKEPAVRLIAVLTDDWFVAAKATYIAKKHNAMDARFLENVGVVICKFCSRMSESNFIIIAKAYEMETCYVLGPDDISWGFFNGIDAPILFVSVEESAHEAKIKVMAKVHGAIAVTYSPEFGLVACKFNRISEMEPFTHAVKAQGFTFKALRVKA